MGLPRLQIQDSIISRQVDIIIAAIDTLRLWVAAFPVKYTTSTRPTPCALLDRTFIVLADDGAAESLQICLKSSTGSYSWKTIVSG